MKEQNAPLPGWQRLPTGTNISTRIGVCSSDSLYRNSTYGHPTSGFTISHPTVHPLFTFFCPSKTQESLGSNQGVFVFGTTEKLDHTRSTTVPVHVRISLYSALYGSEYVVSDLPARIPLEPDPSLAGFSERGLWWVRISLYLSSDS